MSFGNNHYGARIMKGKMNGISLFTGYAGIDLALSEYVRPLIYCDIEKFAQGILLSRMDDESIPFAPIWNDVTTLDGKKFRGLADIVYGGFPCQDISSAGKGAGLDGERSGLFFEVVRICQEASPTFIFLENVPAIRTRGSFEVQEALASIGYDCRFGVISAAEVGANHLRERWFCLAAERSSLANACSERRQQIAGSAFSNEGPNEGRGKEENNIIERDGESDRERNVAHPFSFRAQVQINGELSTVELFGGSSKDGATSATWWSSEPAVGRVANGITNRMDRIKALGNGVVPLQVKTAFEILMGIAQ